MNNQQAYNQWAGTYDTVVNLTRDLKAAALREVLGKHDLSQSSVLEIGCGTGKNTEWLLSKARQVTGVDFSAEMLAKARQNLQSDRLEFIQTDIREAWPVEKAKSDLITCSLVLEHIENLEFIFEQASLALAEHGLFYIGELHPGKQYVGSKARFDTGKSIFELDCYIHHVSDYLSLARNHGFSLKIIQEWFDNDDRKSIPRLLTLLFQKSSLSVAY